MNLNDELSQSRTKLYAAFQAIGFSNEDTTTQLSQLSELISTSVLVEIVKKFPEDKERIMADPESFIAEHFDLEEFHQIFVEVSGRVTTGYISEISDGLTPEKKTTFLELMAS